MTITPRDKGIELTENLEGIRDIIRQIPELRKEESKKGDRSHYKSLGG